jgi:hypothetical protein
VRGVCMLRECLHGQMPRRREAEMKAERAKLAVRFFGLGRAVARTCCAREGESRSKRSPLGTLPEMRLSRSK